MIFHLSIAARDAEKAGAFFATVRGCDYSAMSELLMSEAVSLRKGIKALKASKVSVS